MAYYIDGTSVPFFCLKFKDINIENLLFSGNLKTLE